MISDLLNIGNDIRTVVHTLESRSSFDRIHLADLLEHIGQVLKDTGIKISLGQHPGNHRQMEILSEELYFKLAFVVGEVKAHSISKRLMQTQRIELLKSELSTGFGAFEHALLEEAATNFIDTSRFLRMN